MLFFIVWAYGRNASSQLGKDGHHIRDNNGIHGDSLYRARGCAQIRHSDHHRRHDIIFESSANKCINQSIEWCGIHSIKRGYDVDRFNNPVQPDNTDAIFVKDLSLFIIQASHPVSLEPTELGGRHHVISFYDAYDEEKLQSRSAEMATITEESNRVYTKLMESMSEAIQIHDEWEKVNVARMMWHEQEKLIASLKEELFGTMKLHKKSTVSHRLAGSLAPGSLP